MNQLTYEEALARIHAAPRLTKIPDLGRMRRLCAALGNPQERVKFVHVAGTNGKGSTAHMIAAALAACGYRTGLFTSPYVVDFCERIQLDGEMIPREDFARIARRVLEADEALAHDGAANDRAPLESAGRCKEFELVTACGFLWFLERGCDIAVLEVGLGGLYDATNVIPRPECAVLCRIAFDHMELLGHTLREIALRKCGVIKGGDVVCYPRQEPEALETIRQNCREKGAALHIPDIAACAVESVTADGCRLVRDGVRWDIPLGGEHQIANALAALEALGVLRARGFRIDPERARAGIAAMRFAGRLERVADDPPIYLDGAHNPDGAAALARALGGEARTVVFAAMRDKDYAQSARILAQGARRFIACGLDMERAAEPERLLAPLRGCACALLAARRLPEALAIAYRGLARGERIVICGSLYLVAEARALLLARPDATKTDE